MQTPRRGCSPSPQRYPWHQQPGSAGKAGAAGAAGSADFFRKSKKSHRKALLHQARSGGHTFVIILYPVCAPKGKAWQGKLASLHIRPFTARMACQVMRAISAAGGWKPASCQATIVPKQPFTAKASIYFCSSVPPSGANSPRQRSCNQLFGVAGELRLPAFAVEGLTEVGVLGHVGEQRHQRGGRVLLRRCWGSG